MGKKSTATLLDYKPKKTLPDVPISFYETKKGKRVLLGWKAEFFGSQYGDFINCDDTGEHREYSLKLLEDQILKTFEKLQNGR